jgi:hypothetical protein
LWSNRCQFFDNQDLNLEETGGEPFKTHPEPSSQSSSSVVRRLDHGLTIFELRQARPDLRGDADWSLSGYGHCQDFFDHVAVVFGAVAS